MLWQATQLRYSVFPSGSATVDPDKWWQAVLQSEPDHVQLQPKANVAEFRGAYANGQMIMGIGPGRIDWLYIASDDEFGLSQPLGSLIETLDAFEVVIRKWLDQPDCPSAKRIALGAILRMDVDSREQGFRSLDPFLPGLHLSENASDLIYQINRPRTSTIGEQSIRLNRLSKWSVVFAQAARQTVMNSLPLLAEASQTYAQLEMDINTVPAEEMVLSPREEAETLQTLTAYVREIAERGDVP